jgi:hypothetical protein
MGYHGELNSKPYFEHNIINFMTSTQNLHNLHIAPSPILKVSWSAHLQIERSTKNFNFPNKLMKRTKSKVPESRLDIGRRCSGRVDPRCKRRRSCEGTEDDATTVRLLDISDKLSTMFRQTSFSTTRMTFRHTTF